MKRELTTIPLVMVSRHSPSQKLEQTTTKSVIQQRLRKRSGERAIPKQNILAEIVQKVVEAAVPEKIILFGSRAKAEQTKECDYDIRVLKKGIIHKRKLAQGIYMALDINASVDVIAETPERFNKLKTNPFLIYHDIAKYGRVVCEK